MTIEISTQAIRYQNGDLSVLDQRKLPHASVWLPINKIEDMCQCIETLAIRGAPLIGIAAAVALGHFAKTNSNKDALYKAAEQLKGTRPTAVNLAICLDRMLSHYEEHNDPKQLLIDAYHIYKEDVQLCQSLANFGISLLHKDSTVVTYCNSGNLATGGIGTALGIIKHGYTKGHIKHVYVCETRPLCQGARLTCWELHEDNIPHTLICDNMIGSLFTQHSIDAALVGADRIAANGDFANKIGTYNLAVLSYYHQIPLYVAAPYTTVDLTCQSGKDIVIEQRHASEVHGMKGYFDEATWSRTDTKVWNPAFDVTPHSLVKAYVLNNGIFQAEQLRELTGKKEFSKLEMQL